MRISKEHREIIKATAQEIFGASCKIYLFGSRVNDQKKGGDIDLYLETTEKEEIYDKRIKMIVALQKILGEQRIDLVVNKEDNIRLIDRIAKKEGILL